MCNPCTAMHLASTGNRHVTEQDDQEMIDFFTHKKIVKRLAMSADGSRLLMAVRVLI